MGVGVYRLYDFTKAREIWPYGYYFISGKVNSADKRVLVQIGLIGTLS